MRISSLFLLIFFFACNSNGPLPVKDKQDQSRPEGKHADVDTGFKDTVIQAAKTRLSSFWTDGSTENATLEIRQDSIYYVDQSAAYKYTVSGDSILIYYPDFIFRGLLKISENELVMVSEDDSATFTRFTDQ